MRNCNCTIWVIQDEVRNDFWIMGTTVNNPNTKEVIFEMHADDFAREDFKETIQNIKRKASEYNCCITQFFVVDPGNEENDQCKIVMQWNTKELLNQKRKE